MICRTTFFSITPHYKFIIINSRTTRLHILQCKAKGAIHSVVMGKSSQSLLNRVGAFHVPSKLPQFFHAQANLTWRLFSLVPSTPHLSNDKVQTRLRTRSSSLSCSGLRLHCLYMRGPTMASNKNNAVARTIHSITALRRWSVADKQLPGKCTCVLKRFIN